MDVKIPFTREIEFSTNISEITKMSLEHDYNINNGLVLGNFYISGEYKTHEVSVNTDDFNYTLPFEVELSDNINEDSLEFNIEDFSYDVKDNKKLIISIIYSLKAEKNMFERVDEDNLKTELESIDEFLDNVKEGDKDVKEIKEEDNGMEEEYQEKVEDRITNDEEKTIMDTIKDSDDTFVTYHVHIVNDGETIETICNKYNVPSSLISEYNNIDNISSKDKIIIPKIDE